MAFTNPLLSDRIKRPRNARYVNALPSCALVADRADREHDDELRPYAFRGAEDTPSCGGMGWGDGAARMECRALVWPSAEAGTDETPRARLKIVSACENDGWCHVLRTDSSRNVP